MTSPSHDEGRLDRIVTVPNAISLGRLACVPLFLWLLFGRENRVGAALLLAGLGATDWVDGYIARRQGITRSGAFLDPLADKCLILGAMFALVVEGLFWWLPVVLIAVREVAVSLYRTWMGKRGISIPARWWAKVKTVVQELALGAALIPPLENVEWPADLLLYAGAVLAVVTGVQYVLDGRRAL